jgi:hypothetical protein
MSLSKKNISGNKLNSTHNHWWNLLQINSVTYSGLCEKIIAWIAIIGIQCRLVCSLNHMQGPYNKCKNYRIERANDLLEQSLCLPSRNCMGNIK